MSILRVGVGTLASPWWGIRWWIPDKACITRRGEALPFSLNLCQLRERHDGLILFSWTYTLRACVSISSHKNRGQGKNAQEDEQEQHCYRNKDDSRRLTSAQPVYSHDREHIQYDTIDKQCEACESTKDGDETKYIAGNVNWYLKQESAIALR